MPSGKYERSEEQKQRMKEIARINGLKRKGTKVSYETRQKMRAAKLGKKRGPFSAEHIEHLREAHKGPHYITKRGRKNINAGIQRYWDQKQPEEKRQEKVERLRSIAKFERTEEQKQRLREIGRIGGLAKPSLETRRKISDSKKGRKSNENY